MAFALTTERLYLNIPWQEERWEQDAGLEWDDKKRCWWLPRGLDPLRFREYWSFLDKSKTYDDRASLIKKGCRFKPNIRNTLYVPEKLDFDDFIEYYTDICCESDEGFSLINDKSLIDDWWEENSYMYDDYSSPYEIEPSGKDMMSSFGTKWHDGL